MAERPDVDAIKARLAVRTPGEWWIREGENYRDIMVRHSPRIIAHSVFAGPDALLIRHAPQDLAALLAENERLREALGTEMRRAAHFRHKALFGPDSECSADCPVALLDGGHSWGRALNEALELQDLDEVEILRVDTPEGGEDE